LTVALAGWVALKQGGHPPLAGVVQKMKNLGEASVIYATEHGGLLPLAEIPGPNDWSSAGKLEAAETWYNTLPCFMGAKSVGEIGSSDRTEFYEDQCPLIAPGLRYPKGEKKLDRPFFAFGMNRLLYRGREDRPLERVNLDSLLEPVRTVVFLERGMPEEKKRSSHQRDFTGGPAAGPHSFAGRHHRKAVLLFGDGHIEIKTFEELVDANGRIRHDPRQGVLWTRDPDEDPN
jgi:hypothetical protein